MRSPGIDPADLLQRVACLEGQVGIEVERAPPRSSAERSFDVGKLAQRHRPPRPGGSAVSRRSARAARGAAPDPRGRGRAPGAQRGEPDVLVVAIGDVALRTAATSLPRRCRRARAASRCGPRRARSRDRAGRAGTRGGRRSEAGERRDRGRHDVAVADPARPARASRSPALAARDPRSPAPPLCARDSRDRRARAREQLRGARSDADPAERAARLRPALPRTGRGRAPRRAPPPSPAPPGSSRGELSQRAQRRRHRRPRRLLGEIGSRRDRGGSRRSDRPTDRPRRSFGFSPTAKRSFSFAARSTPALRAFPRGRDRDRHRQPEQALALDHRLHLADLDVEELAVREVAMLDLEDRVAAAVHPVGEEPVEALAGRRSTAAWKSALVTSPPA